MKYEDNFKTMPKGFGYAQATAEVNRCLLCHDAPCSKECPADTKPAEFIRKFRLKNVTGAIRTIKENNILGGACGVLCPTNRLCEKACSAKFVSDDKPEGADRPIQIGKIQRFLVEYAWQTGFIPIEKKDEKTEKIAVVGSGPGGLSCAAELAKNGYPVTIFESRPEPGGVLRYGVISSRFDMDFLEREINDVTALGVDIQCNSPIDKKAGAEKLLDDGYSAVFMATGLWAAASLKNNKNEIFGLYSSVDYLSALRDGRFNEMVENIEDKTVAVIGGGSVAMDCIQTASKIGAKDVYLVYRRSYAQMPAEPEERIEAMEDGVHFILLNQLTDYVVNKDNQIEGVKLVRTRLGDSDESGRRKPEIISDSEWVLDADVVIEAIGNTALENSPEWYPSVTVDEKNLIKVAPETGKTNVDGIFAGGDAVRGPALVVQAVQDGKTAARAIVEYLKN
ncbi:MAG: FAD-dependent oxidoreductase [Desulfobacterales bacterium]|nr:FAD-dependent oxidoreductase [Desulfobacterales bacterium]